MNYVRVPSKQKENISEFLSYSIESYEYALLEFVLSILGIIPNRCSINSDLFRNKASIYIISRLIRKTYKIII